MAMNNIAKAALLLVFLGLIVAKTSAFGEMKCGAPSPPCCDAVYANITACVKLADIRIGLNKPSGDCCSGLGNLLTIEAMIGTGNTCRCAKNFLGGIVGEILGSSVNLDLDPIVAACKLNLNFSLSASSTNCPA